MVWEDKVYYSGGIWPSDGVFLHALDAAAFDRLADSLLTLEDLAALDAWLATRSPRGTADVGGARCKGLVVTQPAAGLLCEPP
mgnify:CR=1 FL=1